MSTRSRTLHVVWSPNVGPAVGYWDPTLAWTHARTMLGVDVAQIEVRDTLPEIVRTDLDVAQESEFDDSGDTPVIAVDDIDDGEPR